MKHIIILLPLLVLSIGLAGCGSGSSESNTQGQMMKGKQMQGNQMQGNQMQGNQMQGNQMQGKQAALKSSKDWIRSKPVDVRAVDKNHDGYVYQDQMDWNVLADEPGKCPICGMTLKRVSVAKAMKNLMDHGIKVQ